MFSIHIVIAFVHQQGKQLCIVAGINGILIILVNLKKEGCRNNLPLVYVSIAKKTR
jgi:hypothetical protein